MRGVSQETPSAPGTGSSEPAATDEDVRIPSVCKMCGNGCGILVHRVNGVVVKIEGNPDNPHNFGKLCAKGHAAIMALYDPHRLRGCLKRTNPRKGPGQDPGWKEIGWEEAMAEVVSRMRKIAEEDPRKLLFVNGIGEVEMSRLVGTVFAEAFRTPNYTTGVFFGTHTRASYMNVGSMHSEPDLDYCRLLLLFGSQKGSISGHDTMKSTMAMANARERGMKVVVFDPVCSPTASKATEWIPLIPGTDGAVALALLHALVNELGILDERFLQGQTNAPYLVAASGRYARQGESGKPLVWDLEDNSAKAYDDPDLKTPAIAGEYRIGRESCRPALELFRRHISRYTPEVVEKISTVPAETLRRVAREFGESAEIGAAIQIDGMRMPRRPVCSFADSRGSTCHTQGVWTGTAIQLLNVMVGALDVPGGCISTNIVGPNGQARVTAGRDGMIVFGSSLPGSEQHQERKPATPETAQLHELFPVGKQPRPMLGLGLLDFPELIPYRVEMMVLLGSNVVMSGADPRRMAEAFQKIPFVVALGDRLDETLECADLIFPIAQGLERLDFPANRLEGWVTGRHWYFTARQPAAATPPDVRHTVDLFIEWAERLGLLPEVNRRLNAELKLKNGQNLEPDRRYSNREIVERRMRSMFGEDHGLSWFEKHGLVAWERALPERYPRGALKIPRVPVYFPDLLDRAQELKEVLERLELKWDLSSYQALPFWHGCWSHETRQPDQLFAVNYKLPFQTSTTTQYNPWLAELSEHHRTALYVTLNSGTARARGVGDGDEIELTGVNGYTARGRARLSECVHPDVVAIASCFGHWSRGQAMKGIHFNSFIPLELRGMEMLSGDYDHCALVTVRKLPKQRKWPGLFYALQRPA
jgi:anaerobic selenocysteine-containing dehydrogenase